MTASDFIARALSAAADSAERILYSAAAFDALVADDLVLVGGGAQVTYTGVGRLTDVDLVGVVTEADTRRLQSAGFLRHGRHWVCEGEQGALAIEVPGDALMPEETYQKIEIEGGAVRVISVTDLMMDRLLQATDGTEVTRAEAEQLAVAAGTGVDWEAIAGRADRVASSARFLAELPSLVAEFRALADN